ncbi:hypothetical protein VUR80DRAFT_4450 [Thermomyces stellatus]
MNIIALVRNITYQTLDVTRESDFEALQSSEPGVSHLAVYRGGTIISGNMLISIDRNRFDVVVMNIAIMDVEPLDPLATALPQLLKRGRVFVGTILHPVFITLDATSKIEVRRDPDSGRTTVTRSGVITQYLHVPPYRGVAHDGQPTWQLYFHRPLHELLGMFFKAGLVLDVLEEPHVSGKENMDLRNPADDLQIPVLIAFRLQRWDQSCD